MKISLQWLSDFLDITLIKNNLNDVLERLTLAGLEVEVVKDLSKGFEKVVVAQVLEKNKHPDADRLSVCKVSDGSQVLQIVCGAQNFKQGDKVCLSLIGAKLPNGVLIEKSKIRGVESFGMLCSEEELGLALQSEGILVLPQDAPLGTNVAEYLGLNDVVFEINVTPNRGDALSHLGVAREIAVITGQKLKFPEIQLKTSFLKTQDKCEVIFSDEVKKQNLCPQYHASFIDKVVVKPSPDWIQKRLKAVGLRPINNIVDITNYVLMEFGTPMHAFDFYKLNLKNNKAEINVRLAQEGEKLLLLDGSEVSLRPVDIVIADSQKPIALAGVMGGEETKVDEKTTSIVLECAQFDSSFIRKTSKAHQKQTDSSYRFERKIDPLIIEKAKERALSLIAQYAQGEVYSDSVSIYLDAVRFYKPTEISISIKEVEKKLGVAISENDFEVCLKKIGFIIKRIDDRYIVQVPSHRPDVSIKADIIEEFVRVWGYDKIPPIVPKMEFMPDPLSDSDIRAKKIYTLKQTLVGCGFFEAINFAFTSKKNILNFGEPKINQDNSYVELQNPLSEELCVLKTSLLSGLMENFLRAYYHQIDEVRIFEIRPVFSRVKPNEIAEFGVQEKWQVAGLMTGYAHAHSLKNYDTKIDFYDAKAVVEKIFEALRVSGVRFEPNFENHADFRFHPYQKLKIIFGKDDGGLIARIHPKIESEIKAKNPIYYFELDLDLLLKFSNRQIKISALPKFPKIPRDFSFIVPDEVLAEKVVKSIYKHGKPFLESVEIIDIYRSEKINAEIKSKLDTNATGFYSITCSAFFSDSNKTLEDKEIEPIVEKIILGLKQDLNAVIRDF